MNFSILLKIPSELYFSETSKEKFQNSEINNAFNDIKFLLKEDIDVNTIDNIISNLIKYKGNAKLNKMRELIFETNNVMNRYKLENSLAVLFTNASNIPDTKLKNYLYKNRSINNEIRYYYELLTNNDQKTLNKFNEFIENKISFHINNKNRYQLEEDYNLYL